MTRIKKTRAPGKLGASKKVDTGNTKLSTAKGKRHKAGNKSGSRQAVAGASTGNGGRKGGQGKDQRLGSTKPVALVSPQAAAPAAKKAKAPKQAKPELDLVAQAALLENLENDERLNALLDRLDEGQFLSSEEEQYVEEMTTKIEQLMTALGITDDEDELIDDIDWDDEEEPA
ncbi:Der GTPase-activating protein YihI [Gallaecimonas xiamenensis]|uniref:Der GTPase activator n=1 Tax=Gallaecimonas xiamenensis 3-C-1 TaxID=745411 RepID=K2K6F3_9GAMM|nr:Der GTPase-activating protein YihI [Gallaecimonas xiamenensis]EKE73015.1 Der GTPase activator [Gallaecimonas xiamenensis 3-C-1]